MSPEVTSSIRLYSSLASQLVRPRTPITLLSGVLGIAGLLSLAGCSSFESMLGWQAALTPIQIQKNDQMTLANLAQAKSALNAANGATCAAAAPYTTNATLAYGEAARLSSISGNIAANANDASNQLGSANLLTTQINELIANNRLDLVSAKESFYSFFDHSQFYETPSSGVISPLMPGVGPDQMLDSANNYLTELRQSHENMQVAVDAFSDTLRTTKLADWMTPPPDPSALVSQLQQQLGDDSVELGQVQIADSYGSFQGQMIALDIAGRHLDDIQRGLSQALTSIAAARTKLESFLKTSQSQTLSLTDDSYAQAAEATRNAWLAIEACGGAVPPDLPPLENPFSSVPSMPDWNSTFWDIES